MLDRNTQERRGVFSFRLMLLYFFLHFLSFSHSRLSFFLHYSQRIFHFHLIFISSSSTILRCSCWHCWCRRRNAFLFIFYLIFLSFFFGGNSFIRVEFFSWSCYYCWWLDFASAFDHCRLHGTSFFSRRKQLGFVFRTCALCTDYHYYIFFFLCLCSFYFVRSISSYLFVCVYFFLCSFVSRRIFFFAPLLFTIVSLIHGFEICVCHVAMLCVCVWNVRGLECAAKSPQLNDKMLSFDTHKVPKMVNILLWVIRR